MQTISEKRYKLIPVTDLDIVYVGGLHDQITYGKHDVIVDETHAITVYIYNEKSEVAETITCLKRNMVSYKYRDRLLKVEDKSPLPTIEGDAPTGD